ncbi:MAG: 50S ribosomal protein L5, partial [Sandaracinaceae bacterium]|nr:50S ribosomal protein L5 [Sandaracinaceae bacterium]
MDEKYVPRLLEHYRSHVVPALQKEFGFKNVMEVPRFVKVTINMGLGRAVHNQRIIESALNELSL